jgi:hypothetical protein
VRKAVKTFLRLGRVLDWLWVMKGKEATLKISMVAFTQLGALGCGGTFFTEFTRKGAVNNDLILWSLLGMIMFLAFMYRFYRGISQD